MICLQCGNYMEEVNSYGDGWEEPIETHYACECGVECWDNQAFGQDWIGLGMEDDDNG